MLWRKNMNRHHSWFWINITSVLILVAGLTIVFAQDNELETKVDAYIKPYLETGNYSGTILLAKDGKIILNKGYGYADYEQEIPAGVSTKYPLGSIGKQVTAVGIMQLIDKGIISEKDTINKFLPKYRYGKKITVHHLLTHTSGIPELNESSPYANRLNAPLSTPEGRIELLNRQKLNFNPGSSYRYTNIGFWLLARILETASGEDFEDYIQKNIFDAAGMNDSYTDMGQIIKKRATGHYWMHQGLVKSYYFERPTRGAFFTTTGDMYKFLRGIIDATLISAESRDKMLTLHNDVYGYGFFISDGPNGKTVWHGGNSVGYRANVMHSYSNDLTMVIFTNIFNCPFYKIVNDLSAIVDGKTVATPKSYKMAQIDMSVTDQFIGSYRDKGDNVVEISRDEEGLYIDITRKSANLGTTLRNRMGLFPMAEDRFFVMDLAIEIYFPDGTDKRSSRLHFISSGKTTEMERFRNRNARRNISGPPVRRQDDDSGPP